jgi:hypothetical protein
MAGYAAAQRAEEDQVYRRGALECVKACIVLCEQRGEHDIASGLRCAAALIRPYRSLLPRRYGVEGIRTPDLSLDRAAC